MKRKSLLSTRRGFLVGSTAMLAAPAILRSTRAYAANPTLRMTDIRGAVDAARSRGAEIRVVIDNTFLGPVFQHPLALGADLCVYSATKYLAGFSDMLGGVVTARDPELVSAIKGTRAIATRCWLTMLPTSCGCA